MENKRIIYIAFIIANIMKHYRYILITLFLHFLTFNLFSQAIGGTKTICSSGCNYPSLNAAINALNVNGVAPGGAVLELANGHNETIPVGGFSIGSTILNNSLNSNSQLIIRKTLISGSKPTFTSGAGNGTMDAMLKIIGVDFLKIENLVFRESNLNTTPTSRMEYGIMLVKKNDIAPLE